jgi:PTH2 family peptidyl-tRNA hydrolase
MRQLIIARKDLNMSPGKLAAQVSHASLAYFTTLIRNNTSHLIRNRYRAKARVNSKEPLLYKRKDLSQWAKEAFERGEEFFYARPVNPGNINGELELCEPSIGYMTSYEIDPAIYEDWIKGVFTKTVCEAKNKNQLLKAVAIAQELGLVEGQDYFLIKDACLTELEPEEIDENGVGRTLTCIGFKPLPDEVAHTISKKFQLYK